MGTHMETRYYFDVPINRCGECPYRRHVSGVSPRDIGDYFCVNTPDWSWWEIRHNRKSEIPQFCRLPKEPKTWYETSSPKK